MASASNFRSISSSKTCLLEGIDELGWILKQEPAIAAFEKARVGSIDTLAL